MYSSSTLSQPEFKRLRSGLQFFNWYESKQWYHRCLHCLFSCDGISTSSCSLQQSTARCEHWTCNHDYSRGILSTYCFQDSVHGCLQLPAWSQQCTARLLLAHMLDKVCNPQFGGRWTADTGSVSFNLCGIAARLIKWQSLHACIHPQWLQSKPSIKGYCTQLDAHKAV